MNRSEPAYQLYSRLNQRIIDALLGGICFCFAYGVRFDWRMPPLHKYQMSVLIIPMMLGHVAIGSLLGVYQLIWRYVTITDSLLVARSYAVFSTLLLVLQLVLPRHLFQVRIPLSIILLEFLFSCTAALSARVLRRILDEQQRRSAKGERKKVLLIGAGRTGVMVAKEVRSRADLKPAGFLDDDPRKIGRVINGLRVLGPLGSLPEAIRQYKVQEVLLCIPQPSRAVLRRLWAVSDQLRLPVKIIPTLEEILQSKINLATFHNPEPADLLGQRKAELSLEEPCITEAYRGKCILITGAAGSIGSELADELAKWAPKRLLLFDKDESGLHDAYLRIQASSQAIRVHPVLGDIRSLQRLAAAFSRFRPDVVFHAAAYKHVPLMEMNPSEAILNNVMGTRNLVEHSIVFGVT